MSADLNLAIWLNHFTVKLFNQLSAGKDENFFISPYSISTALAMCFSGAKNETAMQLKELLCLTPIRNDNDLFNLHGEYIKNLNSLNGKDLALHTANKLFPKQGFGIRQEFLDLVAKSFHAEVEALNFSDPKNSAEIINKWVEKKTQDKIKNLIKEEHINSLTRLILVNAIHFKGNWMNSFDKDNTNKADFHLTNGEIVKCDMMHLFGKKYLYKQNPYELGFSTCELPYFGQQVSMTIILPHENVELKDVEKKLNGDVLRDLLEIDGTSQKVNVHVPKFKLEYSQELSEHFKALGATLPFDENKADFTGINDDASKQGLHISKVVHRAVVEVNEEGTEAAAATAVIMMTRCAAIRPVPIIEFNCNKPFLFIIHDKIHHSALFLGKFVKPQ